MSLATERRPKTAPRLANAAKRYRKGKLPEGVAQAADSDDSDAELAQDGDAEPEDVPLGGLSGEEDEDLPIQQNLPAKAAPKKMNLALKDVNISREGKVTISGRQEVGRTGAELEESEEEEEEEVAVQQEEEEEETSSEEESSSEEELATPAFRPVFVPKRGRDTVNEREAQSEFSEEAVKKRELEAEERKKQSYEMVADSIKRELAEKETVDKDQEVDDTDGLDPTTEFEAWRLRELARIKRDKEEELRKEEERAEVERRRALPEEQRLKEDLEHAHKSRADKPKGQQKFLQKYYHKGAFHQDAEILKRHDYTEATESTLDVSMLPKVMQIRNFGKRSQTKYTHLVDQDTTAGTGGFGGGTTKPGGMGPPGGSSSGCFTCGGPHLKKDCPQATSSSSNAAPLGQRRGGDTGWKDRSRPSDPDRDESARRQHDRDDSRRRDDDLDDGRKFGGRDYDRDRARYSESQRRERDRDRRRSRSRSPPRRRYEDERDRDRRRDGDSSRGARRRSRSRSPQSHERDKRRRVD
ncbi:splicing factor, Prp19-binding domain-containing protein [Auriculariales sp. MPI-PUGE-AT-0066]|nr:splicing factor, Prp19-binding domain-containing protein [Auriculariales sp. MPI-PUGE-AT-0066]